MKLTVKNKTDAQLHLEVVADEAALEPLVRQVFNMLRADVKAAGFRPGKAPNEIVEKELGSQRVQAEVIELIAQKAYSQAQREHNFTAVEAPQVNLSKFVPYTELAMSIEIETLAPIKLADYKKFKKQVAKVEVSDEEVANVLKSLQQRTAKRTDVKRAAKTGDEVVFDFTGKLKGKEVKGATSKNYTLLLGSNRFVPGFEEKLAGAKAGDAKKFGITFPKDYSDKEIAGQKLDFEVKVHKVVELELPKLDDKFASTAGPFKDLKTLKDDVKKQIKAEKGGEAQRQLQNEVVQELVENSQVAVPPTLLEKQLQQIVHDFEHELETQGSNLEDYLKQQKKTKAELEKKLTPAAEQRLKTGILLNEVAKAENINITPEELEIRLQLIKGQYKDPQMLEQLERPEVKRDVANQLMSEKTLAKLMEYASR